MSDTHKVVTTFIMVLSVFQFLWFGHKQFPIFKHVIMEFSQQFHRYIYYCMGVDSLLLFQSNLSWDIYIFVSGPSIMACIAFHLCDFN